MKLTFELEETTISDIQNNLDTFADLFDHVLLKICWILLSIAILIFSNPYYFLVILYEKHGEDSMKRSLYNQLIGQASYPTILHNLVCKPLCLECNPNMCYISNTTLNLYKGSPTCRVSTSTNSTT
jgi:hypothetical protein